jgi:hypothetical protein
VGNNTGEVPIQMLSVGLGASIFTFVKTCVERYGSYLILDRSAVAAVDIDLGVVCFADESIQGFTFAVFLLVFHEVLYVPHCVSCIGIVLKSWLMVVSGLSQRFRLMPSWGGVLVHSRRVHIHPYFFCCFAGPITMSTLNPVLKGGESILWYCLMI